MFQLYTPIDCYRRACLADSSQEKKFFFFLHVLVLNAVEVKDHASV